MSSSATTNNNGSCIDLKRALNACKSTTLSYTRIADLREEHRYPIMAFEQVTSPYGETMVVILEDDPYYLNVYLPRRYNQVLSVPIMNRYNAGLEERVHLVKHRAPPGNSGTSPLEFV